MTQYPKHARNTRTFFSTPLIIENLEVIDDTIKENQKKRQEKAQAARERAAKVTKRRRIIISIIAVVVIAVSCFVAFTVMDGSRFAHAYELPRTEIIVHQGDTIDGIAAQNPVEGLTTHELGWVITQINQDRDKQYSCLMPGDKLLIPTERQ